MEIPSIFTAFSIPAFNSVSMARTERMDIPKPDFIPSLIAVDDPSRAAILKELMDLEPEALR